MGMFDRITIEEGVDLPHFPDSFDADEWGWQTKSLACRLDNYRVTADGRLEKKESSYREKTDAEKQEEAEQWGYDSWDEYVQAYDDIDPEDGHGLYPDDIDYDHENREEDGPIPPTFFPKVRTKDEEWWADQNHHGTVEIHASGSLVEGAPDVYLSYELRFTKGELDEIVLMGERMGGDVEETIEKLNEAEQSL